MDTVRVRLMPDIEGAEQSGDLTAIWGGELVYEEVPVIVDDEGTPAP